jgi:hypothetical protein
MIPEEVMNSAAYNALPDIAKVVLFAMAARFNGHNNGDLSLTFNEAQKLGVSQSWKLYAGLSILSKADLILCTRRGHLAGGRKLCSLYAVTWRGISDAPEGVSYDAGVRVCLLPAHDWVKWKKPDNWLAVVAKVKRDNHGRSKIPVSTAPGSSRSTMLGTEILSTDQPSLGTELTLVTPLMVDTSKTRGWGECKQLPFRRPSGS